jgi:hypothetical protein
MEKSKMSFETAPNNPVMSEQNRLANEIRLKLVNESRYTVQPGQTTYRDVSTAIAPSQPEEEAKKLASLNGSQRLSAGMTIATMDPYEIERETNREVALQLAAEQRAHATQEAAQQATRTAAAVSQPNPHEFEGIHFPIRLGVQDHSLKIGTPDPFDLPHVGVSVGQQTGVEAGGTLGPLSAQGHAGLEFTHNSVTIAEEEHAQAFGQPVFDHRSSIGLSASRRAIALDADTHTAALGYPILDAHARLKAGVSRNGVRLSESTSAQVLGGVAGFDQKAGIVVGPQSGLYSRGQAYLGPARASYDHSADIGIHGAHLNLASDGQLGNVAGAGTSMRLALDGNSQFVVGAGGNLGPYGGSGEAGLVTSGNRELRLTAYPTGAPEAASAPPQVLGRTGEAQAPLAMQAAEQPAAPQEDQEAVRRAIAAQIRQDSLYTVQAGERSYADVMRDIDPSRADESPFLAQINHYKRLREGTQVQTLSAQEIDWKTKVAFAQHFHLEPPQS